MEMRLEPEGGNPCEYEDHLHERWQPEDFLREEKARSYAEMLARMYWRCFFKFRMCILVIWHEGNWFPHQNGLA